MWIDKKAEMLFLSIWLRREAVRLAFFDDAKEGFRITGL